MAEQKEKHLTTSDLNKVLPAATAEKYEIINLTKRTKTSFVMAGFGRVDLATLSVARAAQLVARKAPFIREKQVSKPTK
jgi:hypothetical protein